MHRALCIIYYLDKQMHNIFKVMPIYETDVTVNILLFISKKIISYYERYMYVYLLYMYPKHLMLDVEECCKTGLK